MDKLRKTLRDSKLARWSALAIVAFTMLCGYFLTDVMAPLKGMLEGQLQWNSSDFGFFTSAYGWFNVFLLMLIIGGVILDKMGVRFTGMMAATVMVIGTFIKYWAVSTHSLDGQIWHVLGSDIKAQVMIAALGYAIFGVGVEVAGVTVSKIIVKWFKGKEMALAMGLQVAVARIGTALALATSVPIAKSFGHVSKPILLALILLCIGLIAFFIYTFMDKKLDASEAALNDTNNSEEEEFKLSDIIKIGTNKGWWYIAILCVLFYSAVFPFLKYATDLMVQKFNVNEDFAGILPAMLPFGTILLTPFFGNLYDRKGKGATIMIIGAALLIFVHSIFTIPFLNNPFLAIALIIILGIGFSLVPSAMWPSVPKIIPENQLGTAYSLIFWVQNWGLMGVPYLIGVVLKNYCFIGYFAIVGTGFTTSQGANIQKVVLNDNKVCQLAEVGAISRKDSTFKVTSLIKDKQGNVSNVIASSGDTINKQYISDKVIKSLVRKMGKKKENVGAKSSSWFDSLFSFFKEKEIKEPEIKLPIYTYDEKGQVKYFMSDKGEKIGKYSNVKSFYNYTIPMIIFTCLGIVAILFAFLLKIEDRKKGYGLESPNIKK